MRVISQVFRSAVALSCSCAALLVASTSRAGGFALDPMDPAPAGDRFHTVEGADVAGRFAVAARVLGGVALEPLVLSREEDGEEKRFALVRRAYTGHAALATTHGNLVKLGVDVPFVFASGEAAGDRMVADDGALGDVRVSGRIRVVGEREDDVHVALGLRVWMPTGDADSFAGGDQVRAGGTVLVDGRSGRLVWGIAPGLVVRDGVEFEDVTIGDQLTLATGIGALLWRERLDLTAELFGSVVLRGDDSFTAATTNLEALGGATMHFGPLSLGPAAGPGLSPGVGTPTFRALLRVAFAPPGDRHERERPEPEIPEPPPPPLDIDGDGLLPPDDVCPDEAGPRRPTRSGCPIVSDVATGPDATDADGDGVADGQDACPTVAGVSDVPGVARGCPADTDGDSVRDDVDACPNEKGPASDDLTKSGCPAGVRVTPEAIELLEDLQFAGATADLAHSSDALLRQVVTVLAQHPEIASLTIHATAATETLARSRATNVKDRLVVLGIEPRRLSTKGTASQDPPRVRFLTTPR